MIKVDFHIHTTASDGEISPKEVVQRAHNNNVKYLAITDHDTVSGLNEAIEESCKCGITLIPGIELSTQHNNESIHILGFFKDDSFKNEELIKEIFKIKHHRIRRAKKMIQKLKDEFNIEISFEKVLEHAKDTIARPHIAREIVNCGYPYTVEDVFQKFIGKGCKAYVPTLKLSTIDGIKLIKKYNALAFLAHPKLISNTNINEFLEMNLDGIEAIYYQNTKEENDKFIKIAQKNNLLLSCGSDFHGSLEEDLRHGDIGSVEFPYEYLTQFLAALEIKE